MGLDMYLYAERKAGQLPPLTVTRLADAISDQDRGSLYASGYEFSTPDEKSDYRNAVESAGLAEYCDPSTPSATITRESVRAVVGYWRKANQIHKWFVDNCQDGIDECQFSEPISRDKLRELADTCRKVIDLGELGDGQVCNGYTLSNSGDGVEQIMEAGQVLAHPNVARDLLPTQAGFFFGGTDYDEYYIADLKQTVEIIERALKCPDDAVFSYHASW